MPQLAARASCFLSALLALAPPSAARWTPEFVQEDGGARAAPAPSPVERARGDLDAAQARLEARDLAGARARVRPALELLIAAQEEDAAWRDQLARAVQLALSSGDLEAGRGALERLLPACESVSPPDPALARKARLNLGSVLIDLGDPAAGRALLEEVVAADEGTRPDDDLELAHARGNLAVALLRTGEPEAARALQEAVLAARAAQLPPEHAHVRAARTGLANTLSALGDLEGARELHAQVLEVSARTLPADHHDLQRARVNLAVVLNRLGDARAARDLTAQAVDVWRRTLPAHDESLLTARVNLAALHQTLGDAAGARREYEEVLAVRAPRLAPGHPGLESTRQNLAAALKELGDLERARSLEASVLENLARVLPEGAPEVLRARQNLAATLNALGDFPAARVEQERVLALLSRARAETDRDLALARVNLSGTLLALGEDARARELLESAQAALQPSASADAVELLSVRQNLGLVLLRQGELARALELAREVQAARARLLPADHPGRWTADLNLARALRAAGEIEQARALEERVLDAASRALPAEDRIVRTAHENLAWTLAASCARGDAPRDAAAARATDLLRGLCDGLVRGLDRAVLAGASREIEERAAHLSAGLATLLAFAAGGGALPPLADLDAEAFRLCERARSAASDAHAFVAAARRSPELARARDALREASAALAASARGGAGADGYREALALRDRRARELSALARSAAPDAARALELDAARLAQRLDPASSVIAYRRVGASPAPGARDEAALPERFVAFVLRRAPDGAPVLARVALAPAAEVEASVEVWRAALGVSAAARGVSATPAPAGASAAAGARLREQVFDPLVPHLGNASRLIVVLDDVLHLVPFDTLPSGADAGLLGERWSIELRCTLGGMLAPDATLPEDGVLLSIGGVDYDGGGIAHGAPEPAPAAAPGSVAAARGASDAHALAPLVHAGDESRAVGAMHARIRADGERAIVLEGRRASRAALEEFAPRARWLHVATHGWFAPESLRAAGASAQPAPSRGGVRPLDADEVRGMTPMLLCGLALAGANLPADAAGRQPGRLTAEELAALDLTACELAVLSACDTGVGARRAGLGMASLQRALHMAGARSVITSLWKVPDEATKELMLDFYRRLWVEKKPKTQALWESKTALREARDERGNPRYSVRDWAAWVLTGEPR